MRNKWKEMTIIILGAVLFLAACGGEEKNESNNNEDTKKYKIGVTQIVEHPSLNAAYEGFKQAIEDAGLEVDYLVQNAQNDNSANTTIATNLVNSGVDLIFANSTPSAQAVASATQEIPIVFTSVTDAVGAELVKSLESPGGNVTGTIDLHPDVIPQTLTFLKEELGAKNIGMIFNSGEQNAQVQMEKVHELVKEMDLNVIEAPVATSADVKQAVDSLIGKVDALYIIKDNTVVSALESVTSVAFDNKLPMMVGELDSVKRGGLAAYGFNYHDLGYETGQMAVEILKGESKPSELPVQVPKNIKFVINEDTASKIGLEIKEKWNAEVSE